MKLLVRYSTTTTGEYNKEGAYLAEGDSRTFNSG